MCVRVVQEFVSVIACCCSKSRYGLAVPTVLMLAWGASSVALAQGGADAPPLQLQPKTLWRPPAAVVQPDAPPVVRREIPSLPDGAAPSAGNDSGSILPGQTIPPVLSGRPSAIVKIMPVGPKNTWSYRGNRLARTVFVPNVLTGKGAGFFVRTPDGQLHALAVTPEKTRSISIRQEVQRLALQIRARIRREQIVLRRRQ